jgi:small subunit ribosomal protein S2
VERLKDLENKEESGYLDRLPKKETALLRRELEKLRKNLDGIKDMKRLPDLVVIVDQKRESTAVQECRKLGIPIISILDTNCNPELADIPIPANDDAIRSIKLILGKIADAICEGNNGKVSLERQDSEELQTVQ